MAALANDKSAGAAGQYIEINVGGKKFASTRTTLSAIPYFYALLSSKFAAPTTDFDGSIFVDRDGELFGHLLNYVSCVTRSLCRDRRHTDGKSRREGLYWSKRSSNSRWHTERPCGSRPTSMGSRDPSTSGYRRPRASRSEISFTFALWLCGQPIPPKSSYIPYRAGKRS